MKGVNRMCPNEKRSEAPFTHVPFRLPHPRCSRPSAANSRSGKWATTSTSGRETCRSEAGAAFEEQPRLVWSRWSSSLLSCRPWPYAAGWTHSGRALASERAACLADLAKADALRTPGETNAAAEVMERLGGGCSVSLPIANFSCR